MNAGQETDGTSPSAAPTTTSTAVQIVSGKRRKIDIKRIEVQSSLFVAFSKRRTGLFGKLDKFCKMSQRGTEAAIVTFSPAANKAHGYGSPAVDPVLSRFLDHMAGAERPPRPEKRSRLPMVVHRRDDDKEDGEVSGGEESMEELEETEAELLRVLRDVEMRMSEDKIRECRTKRFF